MQYQQKFAILIKLCKEAKGREPGSSRRKNEKISSSERRSPSISACARLLMMSSRGSCRRAEAAVLLVRDPARRPSSNSPTDIALQPAPKCEGPASPRTHGAFIGCGGLQYPQALRLRSLTMWLRLTNPINVVDVRPGRLSIPSSITIRAGAAFVAACADRCKRAPRAGGASPSSSSPR
jgi:hypothetical protein